MHLINTVGLICPEPIMLLHKAIRPLQHGDVVQVVATDPATTRDVPNFCRHLGHQLLHHSTQTMCALPSQSELDEFELYYFYDIRIIKNK